MPLRENGHDRRAKVLAEWIQRQRRDDLRLYPLFSLDEIDDVSLAGRRLAIAKLKRAARRLCEHNRQTPHPWSYDRYRHRNLLAVIERERGEIEALEQMGEAA